MPLPPDTDSAPTVSDVPRSPASEITAVAPSGSSGGPLISPLPALPRYTQRAVLGHGGMGTVFCVNDARIGRDVALKQLHDDRVLTADERARFLREARVQGQLEHPSIVPVYDIDERPDGTMFFTMRRVVGRTLHDILDELRTAPTGERRASGKFTQRELLTAFATVCLAIDYAHSRGVVHRDLKPGNLMFGDFGEVYVLDWGVARLLGDSEPTQLAPASRLSAPDQMMGTVQYMAPEQMLDSTVGPTADVFALGAILFEILTLQRLRTEPVAQATDARAATRAPSQGVAPELEAICVAATRAAPSERTATARELADAVNRYLEGDRELAQRARLAEEHTRAANTALQRAATAGDGAAELHERGLATVELVRALALDPTNHTTVAMLVRTMAAPPRTVPDQVRDALAADDNRVIRIGARNTIISAVLGVAFLPILYAIGVRQPWQLAAAYVPVLVACALAVFALVRKTVPTWMHVVGILCMVMAAVGLGRIFGPLVLVPTALAIAAIALVAHPHPGLRAFALASVGIGLVLPPVLELVDVLPRSYRFEHGEMVILPQMLQLSQTGAMLLLLGASLVMTAVSVLLIGRLRRELSAAKRATAIQIWQFRKVGEMLIRAGRQRRS